MGLKQQKRIASLDIGSNKIVCLIGYINANNDVCIRGVSNVKSKGIQNYKIVDKNLAIESILKAIKKAEEMAGFTVNSITINISSSVLESSAITGTILLNGREIEERDIANFLRETNACLQKKGKEIIHLIPLKSVLDGHVVDTPYNMEGNQLRIEYQLLSTEKKNIAPIRNCIRDMMINVGNYVSNGYANILSVLDKPEKELGVLILDIGASNTNISVIHNNKYLFEGGIPLAGNAITKDISTILNITIETAEKVKTLNSNFLLSELEEEEIIKIDLDSEEDYKASHNTIKLINDIVKARIEEILELVRDKLKQANVLGLVKYVVLTGGTSLIPGIDQYIENILHIDTRIGYNEKGFEGKDRKMTEDLKSPKYSVAIGILRFIVVKETTANINMQNEPLIFKFIRKIFS